MPSEAAVEKLDKLLWLLCAPPDPVADKAALIAIRDGASPAVRHLAKLLYSDPNWRDLPLREILPGLSIIDSSLFRYRLSTKTANGLARGDVRSWAELAGLAPSELSSFPRIGGKAVEEILLAATGEWAAAYLCAAGDRYEEASVQGAGKEQLLVLIRRAPDPVADRQLLITLASPDNADTQWLAERFHRDGDLRHSSLRQLLPGLGLVESPAFSIRVGVRAANCLGRANSTKLEDLAGFTPAAILALPGVDANVAEEILSVVVSEWASSYLGQVADDGGPAANASSPAPNGDPLWQRLAETFSRLEDTAAFEPFRRRQLVSESSPTQAKVGAELGISSERVAQHEKTIRSMLGKEAQEKEAPIPAAVDVLRTRLGTVARPPELDEALAIIDPVGDVILESIPHRRALLLWIAGFRLSAEWLLDLEIESITEAVLTGLTDAGPTDLEKVGRQLARCGVRQELQLPWIAGQHGFRMVDGELVRTEEGS